MKNTINTTEDYGIFKTMPGNRKIDEIHVRRLIRSFKKDYIINPIIINSNFEIIDGQHRLEAAKRLEFPVFYIQLNGLNLPDVQKLNTTNKKWGKSDFLESFCDLGNPEYLKFREFMKRFPDFRIGSAEIIFTNRTSNTPVLLKNKKSKSIVAHSKPFEEGGLRVGDLGLAYSNAEKILEYKKYYDGFNRMLFVRTMIGLFKLSAFSHDVFLKKLAYQPSSLTHCQSIDQYKLLIESIYNFKNRNKVSLRY